MELPISTIMAQMGTVAKGASLQTWPCNIACYFNLFYFPEQQKAKRKILKLWQDLSSLQICEWCWWEPSCYECFTYWTGMLTKRVDRWESLCTHYLTRLHISPNWWLQIDPWNLQYTVLATCVSGMLLVHLTENSKLHDDQVSLIIVRAFCRNFCRNYFVGTTF